MLTIVSLSTTKAQPIHPSESKKSFLEPLLLSQQITAVDLENPTLSPSSEKCLPLPITAAFVASLLNVLAQDGYDILINLHNNSLQSFIKEIQDSDGSNNYEANDEKMLIYLASLDLKSLHPFLNQLLEEKCVNSKNERYLVLKLGTIDQRSLNIQNKNPEADYLAWCETAKNNEHVEYYWFKKTDHSSTLSSSSTQGELWMILSTLDTSASHDIVDLQTSSDHDISVLKNSSLSSSSSSPKTPLEWWNSLSSEQQNAVIKTGVFLASCIGICFFPQLTFTEKLLVAVCLPCFFERSEDFKTSCEALFFNKKTPTSE